MAAAVTGPDGRRVTHAMTSDPSAGWDAVAERFMALRSPAGAALVRSWARGHLPAGGAILDLGCGSGVPIARGLADDGFLLWGIDASPTLLSAFRRHLPGRPAACEAAQDSRVFGRHFDGILAIGLVFLLDAAQQRRLLARVATALEPGGHLLFTAPRAACAWRDTLTGRVSRSLGAEAYEALLAGVGLRAVGWQVDDGGNDYCHAVRGE